MRKLLTAIVPKLYTFLAVTLILVLLVMPLGLRVHHSANAQAYGNDPRTAMEAVLDIHIKTLRFPYNAVLMTHYAQGDWAYGNASYVYEDTGGLVPTEPFVILARRGMKGTWEALVPSEEVADEYNEWLDEIPSELISTADKMFLLLEKRPINLAGLSAVTGYRLPWAGGWGATLTQGPHSGGSHAGIWAWDFDLWQGQWDGMVGAPGYVVAAKSGTVVFAKDAAPDSQQCFGCANVVIVRHSTQEYSWYYHLQQDSIPQEIKEARAQGTTIEAGTVIGVEGSSGYSEGVHLHFMVTDGVPDLSQYDETDVDSAPWPNHNNTLEVDFEDWDEQNTVPYSGNYLDPSNSVILYWDADYKGPSVKFTCSDSDVQRELPHFLDHRASSIRVTPQGEFFAALYSDTNSHPDLGGYCRGWWWTEANFDNDYCDPKEDPVPERSMNDSISSIKVTTKQEYCSQSYGGSGTTTNVSRLEVLANDVTEFCGPSPTNDQAVFVADLTLPDGTIVSPGEALVKTWRVRNSGTATWDGYLLKFDNGKRMNGPLELAIPTTAPGETRDITINLTAPTEQGTHRGNWQIVRPDGNWVPGGQLWVSINVQFQSNNITLTADPPSPASAGQVRIYARVDNFPNLRALRILVDGSQLCELGAPEITDCVWHTSGYAPGQHSIVAEADDHTGSSWDNPERKSIIYELTGSGVVALW